MTTPMVSADRRHRAVIHIATALVTRTRTLCHHHHHRLQWEDTMENGQHNLLCGDSNKSNLSYSHAMSMCLLFHLIT
jgi:D-lyxose ketol-isomerase